MIWALSTNWNSKRHEVGEALVDEVLELGFDALEIGYQFKRDLVPGLMARLATGAITVGSVHAFTPVPLGAPGGHPELFLLASTEVDTRRLALFHLRQTLEFAGSVGAQAVVLHAGRVRVGRHWYAVEEAHDREATEGWRYRWHHRRLLRLRERGIARHLTALRQSLDEVLPLFEAAGIVLAFENLPSWDALPHVAELEELMADYNSGALRAWYDIGHGQIMENTGFGDNLALARRLLPLMAGAHLHDVRGPLSDHHAPGSGAIDFSRFGFLVDQAIMKVFEPASSVTPVELSAGLVHLQRIWSTGMHETKREDNA